MTVTPARRTAPWLVVLVMIVAPTLALTVLVLQRADVPPELVSTVEPIFAEPSLRLREGRQDALVEFALSLGTTLKAGGLLGVVTSVSAARGYGLMSGDPVYAVDRVEIRAMRSDAPLHRDLGLGTEGPDVFEIERYLASGGFLQGDPDTVFDRVTAAAVRAYQADVGIVDGDGRFRPGMVVWLPEEPFPVGEVLVQIGAAAPGAGESVIRRIPDVVSARFVGPDGQRLRFEGDRVLELDGHVVGTVSGNDGVTAETVASMLNQLGESTSMIDGTSWSIPVVLRFPEPRAVFVVASSAVMVDSEGSRNCVWSVGADGALRPVVVDPVGGTFGVTDVIGDIGGMQVLVNPIDVIDTPACP